MQSQTQLSKTSAASELFNQSFFVLPQVYWRAFCGKRKGSRKR